MHIFRVYIASPYTKGDPKRNVLRQIEAAEYIVKMCPGISCYLPLLNHYWHRYYAHDWEFWMGQVTPWIMCSHALLRLWGESVGADKEVELARQWAVPAFFTIPDLITAYQTGEYGEEV